MKTIEITLDDAIVKAVETMAKTLDMTLSAFIQDALRLALQRQPIKELEEQHRQGYLEKPVVEGEFSAREGETDALTIDSKGYAERTKEKSFDELLHEGKRVAQQLLEDQGIASMALYISEMMVQSIELERKHSTKG